MPVRGRTAGNAGKGSKWITPARRAAIYVRDGHRCLWCMCRTCEKTLDHFVPCSLGGTDETENLFLSCMKCNRRRGNRTALAFACSPRFRAPAVVLARILAHLGTPLARPRTQERSQTNKAA